MGKIKKISNNSNKSKKKSVTVKKKNKSNSDSKKKEEDVKKLKNTPQCSSDESDVYFYNDIQRWKNTIKVPIWLKKPKDKESLDEFYKNIIKKLLRVKNKIRAYKIQEAYLLDCLQKCMIDLNLNSVRSTENINCEIYKNLIYNSKDKTYVENVDKENNSEIKNNNISNKNNHIPLNPEKNAISGIDNTMYSDNNNNNNNNNRKDGNNSGSSNMINDSDNTINDNTNTINDSTNTISESNETLNSSNKMNSHNNNNNNICVSNSISNCSDVNKNYTSSSFYSVNNYDTKDEEENSIYIKKDNIKDNNRNTCLKCLKEQKIQDMVENLKNSLFKEEETRKKSVMDDVFNKVIIPGGFFENNNFCPIFLKLLKIDIYNSCYTIDTKVNSKLMNLFNVLNNFNENNITDTNKNVDKETDEFLNTKCKSPNRYKSHIDDISFFKGQSSLYKLSQYCIEKQVIKNNEVTSFDTVYIYNEKKIDDQEHILDENKKNSSDGCKKNTKFKYVLDDSQKDNPSLHYINDKKDIINNDKYNNNGSSQSLTDYNKHVINNLSVENYTSNENIIETYDNTVKSYHTLKSQKTNSMTLSKNNRIDSHTVINLCDTIDDKEVYEISSCYNENEDTNKSYFDIINDYYDDDEKKKKKKKKTFMINDKEANILETNLEKNPIIYDNINIIHEKENNLINNNNNNNNNNINNCEKKCNIACNDINENTLFTESSKEENNYKGESSEKMDPLNCECSYDSNKLNSSNNPYKEISNKSDTTIYNKKRHSGSGDIYNKKYFEENLFENNSNEDNIFKRQKANNDNILEEKKNEKSDSEENSYLENIKNRRSHSLCFSSNDRKSYNDMFIGSSNNSDNNIYLNNIKRHHNENNENNDDNDYSDDRNKNNTEQIECGPIDYNSCDDKKNPVNSNDNNIKNNCEEYLNSEYEKIELNGNDMNNMDANVNILNLTKEETIRCTPSEDNNKSIIINKNNINNEKNILNEEKENICKYNKSLFDSDDDEIKTVTNKNKEEENKIDKNIESVLFNSCDSDSIKSMNKNNSNSGNSKLNEKNKYNNNNNNNNNNNIHSNNIHSNNIHSNNIHNDDDVIIIDEDSDSTLKIKEKEDYDKYCNKDEMKKDTVLVHNNISKNNDKSKNGLTAMSMNLFDDSSDNDSDNSYEDKNINVLNEMYSNKYYHINEKENPYCKMKDNIYEELKRNENKNYKINDKSVVDKNLNEVSILNIDLNKAHNAVLEGLMDLFGLKSNRLSRKIIVNELIKIQDYLRKKHDEFINCDNIEDEHILDDLSNIKENYVTENDSLFKDTIGEQENINKNNNNNDNKDDIEADTNKINDDQKNGNCHNNIICIDLLDNEKGYKSDCDIQSFHYNNTLFDNDLLNRETDKLQEDYINHMHNKIKQMELKLLFDRIDEAIKINDVIYKNIYEEKKVEYSIFKKHLVDCKLNVNKEIIMSYSKDKNIEIISKKKNISN
ncbi:conserved Plasmodium protein, unknown function [Plasmodium gaboni]|uniref:Asparagine-rich protein n=1 Tax=Plasmodium gaboni TaxID=647221 RepID=A0ABY1UQG2_9APIC|nr:conserved Plasmodium protein, unknown function [Plasmodium gaboni]